MTVNWSAVILRYETKFVIISARILGRATRLVTVAHENLTQMTTFNYFIHSGLQWAYQTEPFSRWNKHFWGQTVPPKVHNTRLFYCFGLARGQNSAMTSVHFASAASKDLTKLWSSSKDDLKQNDVMTTEFYWADPIYRSSLICTDLSYELFISSTHNMRQHWQKQAL